MSAKCRVLPLNCDLVIGGHSLWVLPNQEMTMKALTFVSIVLLAMSGATAKSVVAQPAEATAANSQAMQAELTAQRICMRCFFGG